MYAHAKQRDMERRIKTLFDEVDHALEDAWAGEFMLHPNRPARGETWNPEMDGLFELGADFTPGLGSEHGRGYLVNLRVATLERVPNERLEAFMSQAAELIREKLPRHFPERSLEVVRDGRRFKLVGDFSLGST